jgi:hypothetical protein
MRTVLGVGVGLLLVALLPGAAAEAAVEPSASAINRSRIVESSNKKVTCYALKKREAIHCKGSWYSSSSKKVIELEKRGKAKKRKIKDYPGYRSDPKTVRAGDTWRRNGVECRFRKEGITCFNLDGHGFHIGKKTTGTF